VPRFCRKNSGGCSTTREVRGDANPSRPREPAGRRPAGRTAGARRRKRSAAGKLGTGRGTQKRAAAVVAIHEKNPGRRPGHRERRLSNLPRAGLRHPGPNYGRGGEALRQPRSRCARGKFLGGRASDVAPNLKQPAKVAQELGKDQPIGGRRRRADRARAGARLGATHRIGENM